MGLFDGVGGTMGGTMPLGTMTPMGVATSLGAAASAVGLPGFSMVPAPFYLLAGMGWSSGSSYWGHPEFRGVADMAKGSNALQEGWSLGSALGGGLGMLGIGAPPVGGGGYYIGPYPDFLGVGNVLQAFWQKQVNDMMGVSSQQPAGPAQPAAPQPTQVNAKGEEPKADEVGRPSKAGKGGWKGKKKQVVPKGGSAVGNALGGVADGIKSLWRSATEKAGGVKKEAPSRVGPPHTERQHYHDLKAESGWRALDADEERFIKNYERDYGTD